MSFNARLMGRSVVALTPVLVLLTVNVAFAAGLGQGSGIDALDKSQGLLVKFVTALAGIACIALLGILVWDFVQHRNISRAIFEFLGVVLLGVVAVNASTVAGTFTGQGALL